MHNVRWHPLELCKGGILQGAPSKLQLPPPPCLGVPICCPIFLWALEPGSEPVYQAGALTSDPLRAYSSPQGSAPDCPWPKLVLAAHRPSLGQAAWILTVAQSGLGPLCPLNISGNYQLSTQAVVGRVGSTPTAPHSSFPPCWPCRACPKWISKHVRVGWPQRPTQALALTFAGGKTEAQRGDVTCLRQHSLLL